MKLRAIGALVVAAAAIVGLSACQTKVGQAAVINGERISDSELATYATRSGPTASALAAAKQQGTPIEPRVQALTSLLQEQLFLHVLRKTGGVPKDSELAALHDEAAQRLLGGQTTTGDAFDAVLGKQVRSYGFTDKFTTLVLHVAELEDTIINRTKVTSFPELAAKVGQYPVPISVSGRYGSWDNEEPVADHVRQRRAAVLRDLRRGRHRRRDQLSGMASQLEEAVRVMDRLRSPGGCPWDAEQTHASLARYLLEETYEVLEAIETADPVLLREELGDLLLQVLFHARLAEEEPEPYSIEDVAADLVAKLIRRHPHVFAGDDASDAAELNERWERQKVVEKGRTSAVDGVPLAQPALALAAKLVARAGRAGSGRGARVGGRDRRAAVRRRPGRRRRRRRPRGRPARHRPRVPRRDPVRRVRA